MGGKRIIGNKRSGGWSSTSVTSSRVSRIPPFETCPTSHCVADSHGLFSLLEEEEERLALAAPGSGCPSGLALGVIINFGDLKHDCGPCNIASGS